MLNRISMKPAMKVCDLTGLPAQYTCPRTKLNYYDGCIYEIISDLKMDAAQYYQKTRTFGKDLLSFRPQN
jgi:INO80 complex subunit C